MVWFEDNNSKIQKKLSQFRRFPTMQFLDGTRLTSKIDSWNAFPHRNEKRFNILYNLRVERKARSVPPFVIWKQKGQFLTHNPEIEKVHGVQGDNKHHIQISKIFNIIDMLWWWLRCFILRKISLLLNSLIIWPLRVHLLHPSRPEEWPFVRVIMALAGASQKASIITIILSPCGENPISKGLQPLQKVKKNKFE